MHRINPQFPLTPFGQLVQYKDVKKPDADLVKSIWHYTTMSTALPAPAQASINFKGTDAILCLGDSITEGGVAAGGLIQRLTGGPAPRSRFVVVRLSHGYSL